MKRFDTIDVCERTLFSFLIILILNGGIILYANMVHEEANKTNHNIELNIDQKRTDDFKLLV
jgi:hypothetical protein